MDIVVLGTGTAGWIAALLAERALGGSATITVIGSPDLPIVGVGEGTTPQFVTDFLDAVGIPLSRLVAEAGCTLKTTVRFSGWGGAHTLYHHPFGDRVTPEIHLDLFPPRPDRAHMLHTSFLRWNAEHARVPFEPVPEPERVPGADALRNSVHHGGFAVHFDAHLLADLLRRIAVERGVRVVDGRVVEVLPSPSGGVEALRLASGQVVRTSLLFDASGFSRVVVGKHYGAAFRDLSETLRTNRVIPFEAPLTRPVRAVTDAFAMDAGWCWRIPTQTRYGQGYVYDSHLISDDHAREEIRARFPDAGDLSRAFSFTPGYFERIWHHNVLAVGLASHFFEPIEATSIWITVLTVREFLDRFIPHGDARARRDFHAWWGRLLERVVAYLYVHYLTPRRDTPFWATFRERTTPPPGVRALLGDTGLRWHDALPAELAGHPLPFPITSWAFLADGLDLWDEPAHRRLWRYRGLGQHYQEHLAETRRHIQTVDARTFTHEELITRLGGQWQIEGETPDPEGLVNPKWG